MDSYLQAFKKQLTYKSKEERGGRKGMKIKDKISFGDVSQKFLQKVVFGQKTPFQARTQLLNGENLEDQIQNLFGTNKGTETTQKPVIKILRPKQYQRQSLCLSPRARDSPPRNIKWNNEEGGLIRPEPAVTFYQIKNKMERMKQENDERPQLIFQQPESTPHSTRREKEQKYKVNLPKFDNPPSFLDTFINVNKSNPVFRQAFLQNPKKNAKEKEKSKSMKRAASSVLATIKMASLGKIMKGKSETCNEIKKLGAVKDEQEYKKKATAILFKSKKISDFNRSKKKLLFDRRKMSQDALLDHYHSQRDIHEIPELCQSTMQTQHKNRETKRDEKVNTFRLQFYGE